MRDWLEIAIIIFIVGGIAWIVFRSGQANPESTGELGVKIANFDKTYASLCEKLENVKSEVDQLKQEAASSKEVKHVGDAVRKLERHVAEIAENASSREATLDHVKKQVDRLYDVIVTKGMGA